MSTTRRQDVLIGRSRFHERIRVDSTFGGLFVSGQESSPGLDSLSVDDAKARARNVEGLEGQTIPVRFEKQSDRDGWYRASAVTVSTEQPSDDVYLADWSMTLERVDDISAMGWLQRSRRVHLTNSHASTSSAGVQMVAFPPGSFPEISAGATQSTRESFAGDVVVLRGFTADTVTHSAYLADIEDLYKGAAAVTQGLHKLEGFDRAGPDGSLYGLQIGNGIVRVGGRPSGSADLFRLETYDSANGWSTVADFTPSLGGTEADAIIAAKVLRNTLEECIVRFVCKLASGVTFPVEIGVRRGALHTAVTVAAVTGSTSGIRTTAGGFSGSAGVRTSSATTEGHKLVIGAAAYTNAAGGLDQTATGTKLLAFLGAERSGAAAGDQALDVLAEFIEQPLIDERPVAV